MGNKHKKINIFDILENSHLPDFDRKVTNNLYGLNVNNRNIKMPMNTDLQGYTFFTRPQLNLTTNNIRNIRQFYSLLTTQDLSAQRFVRCALDPRLQFEIPNLVGGDEVLDTPLVDKNMGFIPILSNTLTSLSGWPDMVAPTHTTANGIRKEQISMIDGSFETFDAFDLSATFGNFINEPLTTLFQTWLMYSSLVFEGLLYPYEDFITEFEFDYNTRIYRLVMDKTNTHVKKIAATGAAFPASVPTAKFFDLDSSTPYGSQTKEINITFKCMGAMYNDDILIKEFNMVSAIFNKGVRDYLLHGEASTLMVAVPRDLVSLFNYRSYPIIDMETYELKWLVDKEEIRAHNLSKADKKKLLNDNSIDTSSLDDDNFDQLFTDNDNDPIPMDDN